MNIRNYILGKRCKGGLEESDNNNESDESSSSDSSILKERKVQQLTSKATKKKAIILSYRSQWKSKYPWVFCDDVRNGMFCKLCQKFGKPPATACGAWTTRGNVDWNHGTELLKSHNESNWHKDSALTGRTTKCATL